MLSSHTLASSAASLERAFWRRAAKTGGTGSCLTVGGRCALSPQKGEADALSLDGGFIYVAGKCGLVPVLAESQSKWGQCPLWCIPPGHGVEAGRSDTTRVSGGDIKMHRGTQTGESWERMNKRHCVTYSASSVEN